MIQRIGFCVGISITIVVSIAAQTDRWTTVKFGNLECEFPAAYSPIEFTGASGIFYEGGNVYLTVTSLPDTSSMKGNVNRDYTRDFMNVVLDVSRKLQGKVREFRDTVIDNRPGYISKMEAVFPDGKKSYYELLQLLHQDSMRSFSSQYFINDPEGLKVSQRFFGSIRVTKEKRSMGLPLKLGLLAGGVFLLGIATWAVFGKRSDTTGKRTGAKKRFTTRPL